MTTPQKGHLRIGFVEREPSNQMPTIVRVYDLTKTLTAFQRSVYATAAYDMGRKGLTKEQRAQYAWAVTAYSAGSFWTDLIPFAVVTAQQLSMFVDQSRDIWTATQHSIESIQAVFSRKKQESPLAQQNLTYVADIAKAALDTDKDTHIEYQTPFGEKLLFQTTPETSNLAVARRALIRGELSNYPDCIVQDIKTTSPDLIVTVPQFLGASVRCTYGKGNEQHFTPSLKTFDKINIVGAPVYWADPQAQISPDVIEIAYLENAQGDVIGKPSLPTLLQKQMQDDDNEPAA